MPSQFFLGSGKDVEVIQKGAKRAMLPTSMLEGIVRGFRKVFPRTGLPLGVLT